MAARVATGSEPGYRQLCPQPLWINRLPGHWQALAAAFSGGTSRCATQVRAGTAKLGCSGRGHYNTRPLPDSPSRGPRRSRHAATATNRSKAVPVKDLLRELVLQAVLDLRRDGVLPAGEEPAFVVERTRSKTHGDYACNVAMLLAKQLGRNPRELADAIAATLPESRLVEKAEVAGPGLHQLPCQPDLPHGLDPARVRAGRALWQRRTRQPRVGDAGVRLGQSQRPAARGPRPRRVLRRHARQPARGQRPRVYREYYVNDYGRQMDILAVSVWLRYLDLGGVSVRFPDNGYKGDYVIDIGARAAPARRRPPALHHARDHRGPAAGRIAGRRQGDPRRRADRARQAVAGRGRLPRSLQRRPRILPRRHPPGPGRVRRALRQLVQRALAQHLGRGGKALDKLRAAGHLYEKDGATWFRASAFGDEKDRVVVRENGVTTYFASDIAYLANKFERGYDRIVYVFGADHHGYVARLKGMAPGAGNSTPAGSRSCWSSSRCCTKATSACRCRRAPASS